jgi:integrase
MWRNEHRDQIRGQLKPFFDRVGRRGSKKSVTNASESMLVFCSFLELEPDQIPKYVKKKGVYEVLDEFVGWMVNTCHLAPHSLKNHLSISKKWLRLQGFEISNEVVRSKVELPRMFVKTVDRAPTPDELRRILLHTNTRGKALITMLASSGMRIGELLSLRVKGIDFNRNPVTIYLRAEVTKDRQSRFCFLSDESVMFLKEFLGERIGRSEDYVFQTTQRGREHAVGNIPMTYWNADKILTVAIKNAGLAQKDDYNRDVLHIHSLRKFFFSQLVPALGREVVEALMGHKMFLDLSYRRFTMDQLAEQYLKGMHEVTVMIVSPTIAQDQLSLEVKKQILAFSGFSEQEVSELGDLSAYPLEKLRELADEKEHKRLGLNGNGSQKIIPWSEVRQAITDGWELVSKLEDTNEAIVKLPK